MKDEEMSIEIKYRTLIWLIDCLRADVFTDHDYRIIGGVCLRHIEEATRKIKEAKKSDISEDIQHVSYDDEQCGRTK